MNSDYNNASLYKHTLLLSILNDKKNKSFFNKLDTLLIKKRFDDVSEISLLENIIKLEIIELSKKDLMTILINFLNSVKNNTYEKDRSIYEMIKISELHAKKLEQFLSVDLFQNICQSLRQVSHETCYISIDFIILKIVENFIVRVSDQGIKEDFITLQNEILNKLTKFDYLPEKKEKETHALCWIDKLLSLLIAADLSPDGFICVCTKIITLCDNNLSLYWKTLYAVNYILLQRDFSTNTNLRFFKKQLISKINSKYVHLNLTSDELIKLAIKLLAKKTIIKENFYYLFDTLAIMAKKTHETKILSLQLCHYVVHYNKKHNIFSHRFIRKYFLDTLFDIMENLKDAIYLETEIKLLISIFHVDSYFHHNKQDIFKNIVFLLKYINNGKKKLTHHNFYKYCDVLDYILASNKDIVFPEIIDYLCNNTNDKEKILQHFSLSLNNNL